jgi:thymidylate synthase (FAD)
MRFVRLDDIPFWMPEWAQDDPILMERATGVLEVLENHQRWMSQYFGIEPDPNEIVEVGEPYKGTDMSFTRKKELTSFMRRFAPEGVATGMVWSGNIRTIRFLMQLRTAEGAEEEIVQVFRKIGDIMVNRYPLAFGDMERTDEGGWASKNWKV